MPKIYLSDGAYAELRDGELIITAEDGIRATDTVVLDGLGWRMLKEFIASNTRLECPECKSQDVTAVYGAERYADMPIRSLATHSHRCRTCASEFTPPAKSPDAF